MAAPKDDLNEQFGRTSDAAGNSVPAPLAALINSGLAPLLDDNGRLIVRVADQNGFVTVGTFTEFTAGAARIPSGGVVIETVPLIQLDSIWGYNGNVSVQFFLHLYPRAILPVPASSVPQYVVPVPPGFTTFSFSDRISLTTGYTVAASVDEFVFTPIGTPDLWCASNYYI